MTTTEMIEDLECEMRLETMTDDDIDFSDIPEITDFSNFRPAKDFLRGIAEANYKNRDKILQNLRKQAAEEERQAQAEKERLRAEGRFDAARQAALNLLKLDKLTPAEIAECLELPLSEVQELARKTA